jgi:DHA1 family bicyclomycin/chloramphenicol resistance-like MFS transporter
MTLPRRQSDLLVISLLGSLAVISPFAIDMYLPAFPQAAKDYGVGSEIISLTLSSYFIGLALGQVFYGPLLDRFGRKKPIYAGMGLFILASLGCARATNVWALITLRFVQAIGGCVAQVGSIAMVHDFFPVKDSAKILSLLFLFIAASPLLAPSVGGMAMLTVGWRSVFYILAFVGAVIVTLIHMFLPEGHQPDSGISLKALPILREYIAILKHPRFATYALSGAFSFAGLFTYVAGSPIIFMEGFHVSATFYSGIFAVLATGFIGGSQINVFLLRAFGTEVLFFRVLILQVATGALFLLGVWADWYGLYATLALFYVFLGCAGITYPNAAALALAPFSRNAGSASALLGFLQLGVGAFISHSGSSLPIIAILAVTSTLGLIILLMGQKRAAESPEAE